MSKKTLVVMGNGPSLADIDFELLSKFDTFGLNAAYRAYERLNWWPTYHGCFDYVVTKSHRYSFKNLVEGNNPIKKFFYLEQVSNSERMQKIDLIPFRTSDKWNSDVSDFQSFNDGGNSGVNACQVGVCLGYEKIILVGVDCNYVEHVEGVSVTPDGRLEVTENIQKNPNYWFDNYQQKGDRFNVPQETAFHFIPWNEFATKAHTKGIEVVNCSTKTKLNCFRRSSLEREYNF